MPSGQLSSHHPRADNGDLTITKKPAAIHAAGFVWIPPWEDGGLVQQDQDENVT